MTGVNRNTPRAYHGPNVILTPDEIGYVHDLLILHQKPQTRNLLDRIEHCKKLLADQGNQPAK